MTSSVLSPFQLKKAGLIFCSSKTPNRLKNTLSGMVYLKKTILIGDEAFRSYLKKESFDHEQYFDGRFCLIGEEEKHFIAKTDFLGQDILYYFHKGDDWAFSNSFYYLLEWLQENSFPCELYEPSLYTGLLGAPLFSSRQGNALGLQLLSNNTPVKEIKILPKDRFIRIEKETKKFEIRKNEAPLIDRGKSYEELLYDYVVKWSSRVRSLAERFPHTLKIDITGGLDSRVVLALTSFSFSHLERLHFQSNPRGENSKDFEIASLIGSFLGFPIRNKKLLKREINPEEAYELWKYGNLGVYTPFYVPTHTEPPKVFYLHGSGGENFRQYYSSPAQNYADNFPYYFPNKSSCEMVQKEFLRSIDDLGSSPYSMEGMRAHYQNYRSRFHFGRNWVRSCYANFITPLNAIELHEASKKLSDDEIASNKIHCDLLCLLNPFLATLPFDEVSKSFSLEQLKRSPFKNINPKDIPFTPLEVRRAKEKKSEKETHLFLREDLSKVILEDLRSCYEPLEFLGDFSRKLKQTLEKELFESDKFALATQKASYLISLGTLLKKAQLKSAEQLPLKETIEQHLMQIHHAGKRLLSKAMH